MSKAAPCKSCAKLRAKLAEAERQIAALDARYEPLVHELDELRERLAEFEGLVTEGAD